MPSNLHDLKNNAILGTSVFPAAITATCTGVGVNLSNAYEQAFAIVQPGTIANDPAATYDIKLQSSKNNANIGGVISEHEASDAYADISGATFAQIAFADSKADPRIIEFRAPEPWVRAVITVAGSPTTGAVLGCEIGAQKRSVS
ncbi:MAG: hypothetical protein Q7R41_12315 [Phycisphaerales bacterium]|nr:hypothetical protein [Phycisphaerales bacterium]